MPKIPCVKCRPPSISYGIFGASTWPWHDLGPHHALHSTQPLHNWPHILPSRGGIMTSWATSPAISLPGGLLPRTH